MFEYLGTALVSVDPGFDVLRYLTVRTIGGTITALIISILLGPVIINFLKSMEEPTTIITHKVVDSFLNGFGLP